MIIHFHSKYILYKWKLSQYNSKARTVVLAADCDSAHRFDIEALTITTGYMP